MTFLFCVPVPEYPGVLSVFPNRGRKLQTTRSWQFMGVEKNNGEVPRWSAWDVGRYGEDTIIANLDSGINTHIPLLCALPVRPLQFWHFD